MRVIERIVTRPAVFAGIAAALVLAAAPRSAAALPESAARRSAAHGDGVPQQKPEELHGEVTSVAGDRIHIKIAEAGWLPRAGRPVEIGAEVMGIYAPLKGSFVIVQVDADSCIAQHVGDGEPGAAARGMRAIIDTAYPNPPQSRADYVGDPETTAMVLSMAEGGSREAQHVAAMGFEGRGDHDAALRWWERASDGATDRFFISYSATGRARILVIRGQYREALGILQDAVSRTRPRAGELVFSAYSDRTGADMTAAVDLYVDLLTAIGDLFRIRMEAPDEATRWYSEAADVMAAAASNGAPGPGDPTHHAYLALLNELANFTLYVLEDEARAVPFLQTAARAGDESAQKTLTRLGHRW